ncbi:methyltransferase domain-containing protein [Frankia sp. CiP1_Cm_nod1]|uniref:methyltransferase domain-containing protein n=1 Tax=Frankia sp. CiP1_Cm_nod1 TaxID=2897160 RepID=UPI002023DA86
MYPINRADDPDVWSRLVDSDDAIVTQVDDGKLDEDGTGTFPTSSSSALAVMDAMLGLLDVHHGTDVLEIGTGTGYNAALIAERAAPGHVTTIEMDEKIARHARTVLARTGLPVTVVTGDGALGYAENAPYERVICTASALRVPYAWVEQTRPGGKIVLPLVAGFDECQAFACLTVGDDGTARGRCHGSTGFMRLRNQRNDRALWRVYSPESAAYYDEEPDGVQITTTQIYHPEPFADFETGFAFGARLPGWVTGLRADGIMLLSHYASGSWATIVPGTDVHKVYHQGPRHLWDELEATYRWWIGTGQPDHTRFGLIVTPEGQTFWLDTPDQVISSVQQPAA